MKSKINIKAIIVDLDKTLLHTDKTLSSYTAEILSECKRIGISLIVATARPLRATKDLFDAIDFDAAVVSNGARIICNGECKEYPIQKGSAELFFSEMTRYQDLRLTLETGDRAYSNKPIENYETTLSSDLGSVAKAEKVLKIIVGIDDDMTEGIVNGFIPENTYYTVAGGFLIQIMDKRATKWNGVKAVLNKMKISEKEVAYFGDDNDDVMPVKACGIGIAVSNAIEEVRAVADYITDSNDDDGVAKFIERMIL